MLTSRSASGLFRICRWRPSSQCTKANCIYCNSAFDYAIVQPAEPVLRGGRSQKQAIPPLLIPPERQAQDNFS